MALIRKRRLTEQQQRRIEKQQKHRQQEFDPLFDIEGLVVQHYGRQLEVQVCSLPQQAQTKAPADAAQPEAFFREVAIGDIWRCHTRTNLEALVTGDRVTWQADCNTGLGIITALHPRDSLLSRPDRFHKLKPVAANVNLIVIVIAPVPEVSATLIDRYLVACQASNIDALLVLNKADLLDAHHPCLALLSQYQALGYATCITQANPKQQQMHAELAQLSNQLEDKTVVFVGQSGVGKSTLINQIIPQAAQKTNQISENSELGQHTTTSTRLIQANARTAIIDSPGIREFGLWHLSSDEVYAGFPEFQALYGHCQFRNCSHQHEKQCALRAAVAEGQVLQRRLESLNRLLSELND